MLYNLRYCIVLHCTIQYCFALHCAALHCALHCATLYCTALHCIALRCSAVHTALNCIAELCTALQCMLNQKHSCVSTCSTLVRHPYRCKLDGRKNIHTLKQYDQIYVHIQNMQESFKTIVHINIKKRN